MLSSPVSLHVNWGGRGSGRGGGEGKAIWAIAEFTPTLSVWGRGTYWSDIHLR